MTVGVKPPCLDFSSGVQLNVCFGGNCWTLPPHCTWVGITPATTQLPIDNQGLPEYVCVFPALMQACLFFAPQEDPGHQLFCLPVATTQPKLKHEQFGEQLPAGNARKAGDFLSVMSLPRPTQGTFSDTWCSSPKPHNPSVLPTVS